MELDQDAAYQEYVQECVSAEGVSHEKFEPQREFHGHPGFYKILDEIRDLHSRKNHDYAGTDPLSNLRLCEDFGIPAWIGVLVRLSDKWSRLQRFAINRELEVKTESIEDTLKDMAIYSILCLLLYRERNSMPSVNKPSV